MYSVVIPVYEAAAQVGRCVASWLSQTEKDLELRGSGDFFGTRQSGKFLSDIKNLHYPAEIIYFAKKLSDEAFETRMNFDEIKAAAIKKYESLKDVVLN